MSLKEFMDASPAQSWRRIDYETADVVGGFINDTFFLTVSGTTPWAGMSVVLAPLVYITCPDFWEVELIARMPTGISLPVLTPFSITLSLTGATGYQGTRLVGATKRQEWELPGGCRRGGEALFA